MAVLRFPSSSAVTLIRDMEDKSLFDICEDDLGHLGSAPSFVTFGEVMVRDTPADNERPERTRQVYLSLAGSEYTLAIGLSRLGVPSSFITRVPDNPYGKMLCNVARENNVNTEHFVWAPKTEPVGRFIYEIGRTPRKSVGYYQRMYSAASRLDAGMVNWREALKNARLFHSSGINFGLSYHSNYARNHNKEAFLEAMSEKPEGCRVGMDFNYRATLCSPQEAREVMTPIITEHVDVFVTTIEDMAKIYGISCGQYSARQIDDGDFGPLEDEDIKFFAMEVMRQFKVGIVAITIRHPDSFEMHRWESAAMSADGTFFRSPVVRPITLWDRLGGGDTWNAGFYYALLIDNFSSESIRKGVLIGDACTRIKQTLMFDLPVIDKNEVQNLIRSDASGGGKRTVR